MEGPQFSTKAESELYRSWGCSVIGMTNMPEAKLAREAELCYATVAMVTDYDCWHPDHDHVTVEAVVRVLLEQRRPGARPGEARCVPELGAPRETCPAGCDRALDNAIITAEPHARPGAGGEAGCGGGAGAARRVAPDRSRIRPPAPNAPNLSLQPAIQPAIARSKSDAAISWCMTPRDCPRLRRNRRSPLSQRQQYRGQRTICSKPHVRPLRDPITPPDWTQNRSDCRRDH